MLDAHNVPHPVRQLAAGGEQPVGRVDFAYRSARLLIELDSRKHHTALSDRENDRRRDNELMAAGWRVIRITWWDLVNEPERVVALLRTALAAAAA